MAQARASTVKDQAYVPNGFLPPRQWLNAHGRPFPATFSAYEVYKTTALQGFASQLVPSSSGATATSVFTSLFNLVNGERTGRLFKTTYTLEEL